MIKCGVVVIQWSVNGCFEVYLKEKQKKNKTQKTQITTDLTRRGVRLFDFLEDSRDSWVFWKNNAYLEAGWGR